MRLLPISIKDNADEKTAREGGILIFCAQFHPVADEAHRWHGPLISRNNIIVL